MRRRLLRGGGRHLHAAALLLLLASASTLPARAAAEEAEVLDSVPVIAALEKHVIELEFEQMTRIARGDVADDGRSPVAQSPQGAEFLLHLLDGQGSAISSECSGSAADTATIEFPPSQSEDCSQSASVSSAASGSGAAQNEDAVLGITLGSAGLEISIGSAGIAVGSGDVELSAGSAGVSVGSSGMEATVGSGSTGLDATVGSHDLDISTGSHDFGVSVGSHDLDVSVGSGGIGATVGSSDIDATVGSQGIHFDASSRDIEATVGSRGIHFDASSRDIDATGGSHGIHLDASSRGIDATGGSHGIHLDASSRDIDASVGSGSQGIQVTTSSRDIDASVGSGSQGIQVTTSSSDIDASVGSQALHLGDSSKHVDTTVGSQGVQVSTSSSASNPGIQDPAEPSDVDVSGRSGDGQVGVDSTETNTSTAQTASSYSEERSIILVGTSAPSSNISPTTEEETPSPDAPSKSTVSTGESPVPTEASPVNATTSGSHSGSSEVVKVFSLTASNSSSTESESGSESWWSGSDYYEPYTSIYCRCKATECQNEYPGESSGSTCESKLSDGSCPSGFKTCVSTDSYKVSTSTVTPNSVAEASFTLLAADIIGAFYNLGKEDPMTRKSNWWITISLPSGWRFVTWENTVVEVTLRDDKDEHPSAVRAHSCTDVTNSENCDSDTHRYGFVDVMDLLEGREDLMTSSSGGPMSFVLSKSIVTGVSASSSSVGVSVSLSYETSSGTLKSAATSRRTRELTVTTSEDLSALTLATMELPPVQRGRLDSSLVWMEKDTEIMMLSFATSTIVGPNSDSPKVCVDLRSSYCASKGREPKSTVSFGSAAEASYVQGGNPFLNLYADPGETNLNIESDNTTYFCVTDLLPSGVKTNASWEIRTTFTFQIQVTNMAWAGDEDQGDDYTSGFRLPPLSEIVLMDGSDVMGSDCAQTLVHAKTYSKYTLSVYSVMSITFFAVALAGAILVTRMNGISFSRPTFYNDMTSLSVMMVFILCIVGNAIWISVSTKASSASGTDIYYLLYAISVCFTWTMMTSVCFHWGTVLFHDVGQSGRLFVFVVYVIINVAFYGVQLFGVVSLTDFYKCTYDDYLKNPFYTMRLCSNDYCPDLQPTQWKYAVNNVCKDVGYSDWFFPLQQSSELLIFLTSVALLVLGTFVIQRGVRLIDQSGDIFDDHVVKVMKKSLITYLVVILSIALVLGTSCIMNSILHWKNWSINSVVWYVFSIWLPTLVPPIGFLLLQWNPRLHGMNWNPSLHVKDPQLLHRTMSSISEKVESGKLDISGNGTGLSDGWAGILRFPDTEYNPIGQESVDGTQNVLALAVQLVSPIPLTHACFVELYVAENTAPEAGENDVAGEDYYEDLPVLSYRRSSISTFIESGLHQEGILSRRSHSLSVLGPGALPTPVPVSNPAAKWSRVGFTETVLPTLVTGSNADNGGGVTQIATFLSVLQIPVMPTNPLLRFVVYEIPEKASSPSSDGDVRESRQLMRASSRQLDERARIARVSGMGMAPPSRPKVFCEFSCACDDMLAADEVNLVARQVSCRNRSPIPTVLSDGTGTESPNIAAAIRAATPEMDPSVPRLRVKSMTVSPRQLKENSGFYITKSFQFAEGDEMVIEDMAESPLTNELPRQYLELLVTDRADDLARAQAEAAGFEARVKSGLVGNLYDNLIEQIQGENDQTVVQTWLNERVQQRKMYVEALRECHQLCIDRAEEGLNFKASTEKKSLVLRFLPINLHVQDMWVGPTADLRSQRSRRTSPSVRVYPTVTVGAFAAHCFKFRHNGSILSLRSALQKRSLSRVQSDVSDKSNIDVVDWSNADTRSTDETRWHLTTRFDMCFSQALTTLVTSFCRQLEYSLQHPTDRTFLQTIDSIGFLIQVESLLSTQGKEIGMLEDFSAAVDALKHVTFVLDTSPPTHLPSTLLNLHMKNTTLPSVVSVRLSKGSAKGTFTVAIGVRCSDDVRASIPSGIRSGGSISVTPVVFTQGINEMQTLANNASTKKTTLQDIINRKSFFVLTRYVEKYKQLATQRPDAVPTPMSTIAPLLESLEERIATASKRQVVKSKHPKIIQESSHLCRLLGAGRVTSCKSAKDRTSMSVTLEQVHLLSENDGLPEEFAVRTVSTMRSNGVRLENALKNTGKRQYAFNALQRSLLPDEYKCPEGTYGRGNVS
ncbi:Phosphatidylinositol 3,4,5-trisphosphate-dependent Rac exchanger 2 protein [Phytophthora pseudosyringae]|uniref:Phosphatidylinositol 3,4,5-trisphosphate-dependent Rac exchanger 2 protein n=1 Tax=Phytophthora pseudosyringae TaxID=221518 RepID=A0A8T1VRM9_9STRA|nr:Phosphatidylinositol 3,4,5-trisphosphate-dependent Rac exchanger 2 protein [Phytophthora pseudosyringae]